jgi:hypothetical protein
LRAIFDERSDLLTERTSEGRANRLLLDWPRAKSS